jgi:CheY-specific phosphatase CheX
LANQLLGRLKNRLLPFGVELQIALPVVVSGRAMAVHTDDGLTCRHTFLTGEGGVGVTLTARAEEAFVWEAREEDSQLVPSEGDMLLF